MTLTDYVQSPTFHLCTIEHNTIYVLPDSQAYGPVHDYPWPQLLHCPSGWLPFMHDDILRGGPECSSPSLINLKGYMSLLIINMHCLYIARYNRSSSHWCCCDTFQLMPSSHYALSSSRTTSVFLLFSVSQDLSSPNTHMWQGTVCYTVCNECDKWLKEHTDRLLPIHLKSNQMSIF